MWQTDTVTLQTKTEVNTLGSIALTWVTSGTVLCDVQDINKEIVFRNYGIEGNEFKQVFDHTSATWILGNQVSFDSIQWWIKKVDVQIKIGASNHTFIILDRVV